jgi:hypothetical protein
MVSDMITTGVAVAAIDHRTTKNKRDGKTQMMSDIFNSA